MLIFSGATEAESDGESVGEWLTAPSDRTSPLLGRGVSVI
jgi:hypothetical protein